MIQIKAPDGSIAQFPDGTPDATITSVMARHYGGPTPQMQRAMADAQAYQKKSTSGPFGGLQTAADQIMRGRTLGFSGDIAGGLDAARVGLQNLVGMGPGYGMADAYRATKQTLQQADNKYGQDHPIASTALQLIGGMKAPGMKAAGAYLKGAAGLPHAMARGGLIGAGYGALAGAGNAPDGQRLQGAVAGGGMGAGAGFALPMAGAALAPVARKIGGAAVSAARGVRNIARPADPGAAPTPQDVALARAKVAQIMQAKGIAPNQLQAHPAATAGKPITTAEAIGRPGVQSLGALARRSGPTGDDLQALITDRQTTMPDRILSDFATAAGIHPEAASGDIEGLTSKLQAQAKPLYDAALSSREPVWNSDLANLSQRPVIQKAIASVGKDMLNAGQDPMAAGLQLDPDTGLHVLNPDLSAASEAQPTAQTWDMVKKAIGRQVERNPVTGRPLPDSQSEGNQGVKVATRDLTTALAGDPANGVPGAIPGYRAALDKAGDYLQLQDAFDRGGRLLASNKVNHSDFNDAFGSLDEPSQHAFMGGAANKLYDMAQSGQLTPRKLMVPRVQQKMLTILGPDQGAQFLGNVGLEGQLAATGSRMAPGQGSPTAEFLNAGAEQEGGHGAVATVLHGLHNPLGMIKNLIEAGQAAGTSPQVRGEMGRILMQDPTVSAGELSLVPSPPTRGLIGAQYYPALSAYAGQQAN